MRHRYDLIVRNGMVVTGGDVAGCDVAIADGRIAAIGPELDGPANLDVDATDTIVLPGGVDPHVHFNEPGRGDWEGWSSGSRALIAGGVTTCIEMPLNAHPPALNRASFEAKAVVAQTSSHADFALWGGLTPDNLDHLPELAEAGAIGFKAFMSRSGTHDFRHADDETLFAGMETAARLGLPVAVHAESDAITRGLALRARSEGRTAMRDYLASRPVLAETEAIGREIAFAEATGCRLHIVHVSSGAGIALILAARSRGVDVTSETCPHYLAFTDDDAERIGALAKCAPPLRDIATRDALRQRLSAGEIDIIASDHSPAPPEMKQGDDAFATWGGISGCQHLVAAMLTLGPQVGIDPAGVVSLVATSAARRFGLHRKGAIEVGFDADLAIWQPRERAPIRRKDVEYRHPDSIWDDFAVTWQPETTILRGDVAWERGRTWREPRGRLVCPANR